MEGFLEEVAFELRVETRSREGSHPPGQGPAQKTGQGDQAQLTGGNCLARGSGVCRQTMQGHVGCKQRCSNGNNRLAEHLCVGDPGGSYFVTSSCPQHQRHFSHLTTHTAKRRETLPVDNYKVTPHNYCNCSDVLKHF